LNPIRHRRTLKKNFLERFIGSLKCTLENSNGVVGRFVGIPVASGFVKQVEFKKNAGKLIAAGVFFY